MNLETMNVWVQWVHMIITFGLGAWLYIEKRNDKTNERVDTLSTRVEQIDRDLAGLAANAEAAPSHNDLSAVYKSINELSETVNQLVGENRGQSDTLRLILNQIMQKGMA